MASVRIVASPRGTAVKEGTIFIRSIDLARVWAVLRETVPGSATVWVFGSRAKGTARLTSDLDLALDAGRPLTRRESALLQDAFEESDLPYTVDVVDLYTVSDTFRALIDQDKVLLDRMGVGMVEGRELA